MYNVPLLMDTCILHISDIILKVEMQKVLKRGLSLYIRLKVF